MKLSVVIVNYNVQYFLEQALLSVRKASRNLEVETFVVDNNSVDNSVQMLREKFPEVHLIANKHNPGFSTANNQAIKEAKGDYILLLNPDTIVQEDTFSRCIEFMDDHPKAGALGVKMIDGSGNFLPESKRGFPSPWVAFCKTFGLSKIFPNSPNFNHYHLGYLDKDKNHPVEVLAGAFMLLRKSVLEEIGLLDETFFMYGEDIDLSYRIIKAGYQNYYLADTSIIHYKGESTKKGSLNYVKVFYNAMIIFAKKHFKGNSAKGFVFMLQMAIYFRAFLTLVSNFLKKAAFPLLDLSLIFGGLALIKTIWATNYYHNPDYYQQSFYFFNIPFYSLSWIGAIFFSGGYDQPYNIRRLSKGLIIGTLIIAAVYGFLPLDLRPSRAIILFGAVWSLIALIGVRTFFHFLKFKNLNVGKSKSKNLIIAGSKKESDRVLQLLHQAQVSKNFIGTVGPKNMRDDSIYLSDISQLEEVVQIYKIQEIIFCSKDISNEEVMSWMTRLGNTIDYKIVPKESLSIIGSSSKNTTGELYTVDIQYLIDNPTMKRNKRYLDIGLGILFLFTLPIGLFFIKNRLSFLKNIFSTIFGKTSWVGYYPIDNPSNLPKIRKGILNPLDGLKIKDVNNPTIKRLNFLYAKDYSIENDIELVLKGYKNLGRNQIT